MLSAALAAILAAAPIAGTTGGSPPPLPPMTIRVAAARGISPKLVAGVLAEADAIWRGAGIAFRWQYDDRDPVDPSPAFGARTLHVSIDYETHEVGESHLPLGWIVFDDPATPRQEICVSYANAVTLLERSGGVVGVAATMPRLQREVLLARAMGRALAHELGHYLSASKVHATAGLMRAVQTAFELFNIERSQFRVDAANRQRIVDRMTSIYMASRG